MIHMLFRFVRSSMFALGLLLPSVLFAATITSTLTVNQRSPDVITLQRFLNAHDAQVSKAGPGSLGRETNFFGLATMLALKKFQASNNLPVTGVLDTPTLTKINQTVSVEQGGTQINNANVTSPVISTDTSSTTQTTLPTLSQNLHVGSQGPEVRALQTFLVTSGYLNAVPTGYYGLLTSKAVSIFQQSAGIAPVGYVGPQTRTKINERIDTQAGRDANVGNDASVTLPQTSPLVTVPASIPVPTPATVISTSTLPIAPTVSLSLGSLSVAYHTGTTISWSSANADSCSLSSGQTGVAGFFSTGDLTSTTTYTITCTGKGGSVSQSRTVAVTSVGTPINGVCSQLNGTVLTSTDSVNLCSSGTASSVAGTGPWTWSCAGSNGGTSATCSADKSVATSTQIVATSTTPTPPTVSLSTGSALIAYNSATTISWSSANAQSCVLSSGQSGISGSFTTGNLTTTTTYTISCTGAGGVVSQSKTVTVNAMSLPVNGACSSISGTTVTSIPSTNLCTTGTASSVAGSDVWSWSCAGSNGGTAASCGAYKAPLPTLTLSALSTSIPYNTPATLSWSSANATSCTATGGWSGSKATSGTAVVTGLLTTTSSFTLTCTGAGGTVSQSVMVNVASAPPVSVNGVCGSSSIATSSLATLLGFCTTGTLASLAGTNPFTWNCVGSGGGTTASCSGSLPITPAPTVIISASATSIAYNTATIITWSSTNASSCSLTSGQSGASGSFTTGNLTTATTYTATCTGAGGTASQSVTITVGTAPVSINGSCGSSNATTISSAPSTGLCTTGTASSVAGTGPWTWSCAGSNGGTTASCGASKTVSVTPPVPAVTISASVTSSTPWKPISLFWNATNANSCSLTYDGATSVVSTDSVVGSATSVAPGVTTTYSISCTGAGGTSPVSSVTVSIPTTACGSSNGSVLISAPTANLCTGSGLATAVASYPASWAWSCMLGTVTMANCSANMAPPTVTLSATSNAVAYNTPASLSWSTINASSCTATGGWSGTKATSGTAVSTAPLLSTTTFNLSCSGPAGTTAQSVSVTVLPLNGSCGSASGVITSTIPTTNLCTTGTSSFVSGSLPSATAWTWSCDGANGGTSASCSASKH